MSFMRRFVAAIFELWQAVWVRLKYASQERNRFVEYVRRKGLELNAWARQETARALADENEVPEVTFKRMLSVVIRCYPFMRPMFVHIVSIFLVGGLLALLFTITGTMASDMWDNKMLVNDKLQPFHAVVLFVDHTYVRSEFLTDDEKADAERRGFAGEGLTAAQRKTVRNRMLLWFFIGEVFGIVLLGFFSYYPAWTWQNVSHYLRVAMFERLEYLSLSFHQSSRAGDAIYRIYQDSSMLVNVLSEVIIEPIQVLGAISMAFLFLLAFDPLLAGVCAAAFVPMIYLTAKGTPMIRRLAVANRVMNSNLTSRLQETFAAIKIFKANTAEDITMSRFSVDSQKALDAALYVRLGMIVLSLLVGLVGGLVVIVIEFLIVQWTIEGRETFVPGWALVFVGYQVWNLSAYRNANGRVEQALGEARGIVRRWCMWQDLFIGMERAFYFLDLKPAVADPDTPKGFPKPVSIVAWHNVHYEYAEGKPVLQGVELEARTGTITAIVGNTGSGKSTLMTLLLRLYDPQRGRIAINDIDLKDLRIDDIRSNVAIALQKNVLFAGTVHDNIAFGLTPIKRDMVFQAAEIACAHEFILDLEDGYDTDLGERGSKLSSGQRQRLTIARAVVRDTPILILDEPTASLDARTEHQVLQNLSAWGSEKIVFLITHRLSTIRNADNVAFLHDGRIVEFGSHDALIRLPNGRYRSFVEAEEHGRFAVQ